MYKYRIDMQFAHPNAPKFTELKNIMEEAIRYFNTKSLIARNPKQIEQSEISPDGETFSIVLKSKAELPVPAKSLRLLTVYLIDEKRADNLSYLIYGKQLFKMHALLINSNAENKIESLSTIDRSMSEIDSISFLEWNINARSGYGNYVIPVNIISNEILYNSPDIFVLTEFIQSAGWLDLKHILEKYYNVYENDYVPHQNGICIGIKKNVGIEYVDEVQYIPNANRNLCAPDFYEIKVKINNRTMSIVGARIKIDCKKAYSKDKKERLSEQQDRFNQFKQLAIYLSTLQDVIVIGDFNNSRILDNYIGLDSEYYNYQKVYDFIKTISKDRIKMYSPQSTLSSVGAFWNGKTAMSPIEDSTQVHKYDHIITDFKVIYESLIYDWSFLDHYTFENFEYRGNNSIIKAGFPDHAMLVGKVRINWKLRMKV